MVSWLKKNHWWLWPWYVAAVFLIVVVTGKVIYGALPPFYAPSDENYAHRGARADEWTAFGTVVGVALNGLVALFVARTYLLSKKHGEMEIRGYPTLYIHDVVVNKNVNHYDVVVRSFIKNNGKTIITNGKTNVSMKMTGVTLSQRWSIASGEKYYFASPFRIAFRHSKGRQRLKVEFFHEYETVFKRKFSCSESVFFMIDGGQIDNDKTVIQRDPETRA